MARILVVEDDEICAAAIGQILSSTNHDLTFYDDGEVAWRHLLAQPAYDAILLDRDLPTLNGFSLLRWIKGDPGLRHIPVIMETSASDTESIQEGIAAGAYYYLTKPFQPQLLLTVVNAALDREHETQLLCQHLRESRGILNFLVNGTFQVRTLDDIHTLAQGLAYAFPDPGRVITGLLELLVNAVEHGNLGITYEEKKRLLLEGDLHAELERRLLDPALGQRQVTVELARQPHQLQLTIRDEGAGFNWNDYLEISSARIFDPNGRGIAISRMLSFDHLEYQGNGNTVVVGVTVPLATIGASSSPAGNIRRS